MKKYTLIFQGLTVSLKSVFVMLGIVTLLCSCAPVSYHPSKFGPSKAGAPKSTTSSRAKIVSRVRVVKQEAPTTTIFGYKIATPLSFSNLTRFLTSKDESLDQPVSPIPDFPKMSDMELISDIANTTEFVEDRTLLLLSEAERYGALTESKTLSEIARGSLSRSLEMISPTKQAVSTARVAAPRVVLAVLALCITILVACGYFVVSHLVENMRVRNAPKFRPLS